MGSGFTVTGAGGSESSLMLAPGVAAAHRQSLCVDLWQRGSPPASWIAPLRSREQQHVQAEPCVTSAVEILTGAVWQPWHMQTGQRKQVLIAVSMLLKLAHHVQG